MTRVLRRVVCIVLPLLTVSCAVSSQVITRTPNPSARTVQIRALTFDRQHADLEIELEVDNPGEAFRLDTAEYEVLTEGRSFAAGQVALQTSIAAGAASRAQFLVQLAYLDLPHQARSQMAEGLPVDLVIRGVLRARCNASLVSIEFDGEAQVAESSQSRPEVP